MRILLMVHRLWQGGGTETHVLTLATGLKRMGQDVTLYTSGGPWVAHARSLGIRVHVDPLLYSGKDRVQRVKNYVLRRSIDVIHAHDAPTMRIAGQVRRQLGRRLRVIYTVHGHYVVNLLPVSLVRGTSTTIITVSPALRKMTLGRSKLSASRVKTIPNGIRTDVFRPKNKRAMKRRLGIPENSYVIGYAGRFTIGKAGIGRRVCSVLRRFAAEHPGTYVLIAGRGSMHALTPTKRVRALGHVSDMQTFYNACDLVIGTGRVAAEAVSCAVPTLAIGTRGYHGIVRRSNFPQMIRSNFGDHGLLRPWSEPRLTGDLRKARTLRAKLHSEATRVRVVLQRQLGARQMVSRVLATYQAH